MKTLCSRAIDRITDPFSEESITMVRLTFDDDTVSRCTEDQPFLTIRGYVKAIDLTYTDKILFTPSS